MTTPVAYVAIPRRPRADDDDYYPDTHRTMQVLVDDDAPVDTGLVTPEGTPIYRVTQRGPVGFCPQ